MLGVRRGLKVPHTEGTPSPASLSRLLPHNPHPGFPTFLEAGCDPTPRSQGSLKIPIRSAHSHLISHHTQGKTESPPESPDPTTPMLTGVLPPAAPGHLPRLCPLPRTPLASTDVPPTAAPQPRFWASFSCFAAQVYPAASGPHSEHPSVSPR